MIEVLTFLPSFFNMNWIYRKVSGTWAEIKESLTTYSCCSGRWEWPNEWGCYGYGNGNAGTWLGQMNNDNNMNKGWVGLEVKGKKKKMDECGSIYYCRCCWGLQVMLTSLEYENIWSINQGTRDKGQGPSQRKGYFQFNAISCLRGKQMHRLIHFNPTRFLQVENFGFCF